MISVFFVTTYEFSLIITHRIICNSEQENTKTIFFEFISNKNYR